MKKLSFHSWFPRRVVSAFLIGGLSVSVLGNTAPALAAESVVFTYGPFRRSLLVSDLEDFAKTGQTSRSIRSFLRVSKADPEALRANLTQEFKLNIITADRILNSLPGEYLLYQIGRIVHTPSREANIQATRSAIILSASEGNTISVLDFMKNYPTQGLYIDGVELVKVARDVRSKTTAVREAVNRLQLWTAVMKEYLSSLVCEC